MPPLYVFYKILIQNTVFVIIIKLSFLNYQQPYFD